MEERYHVTTQNRFYPNMFEVNKNIIVEAKLISPPTYYLVNVDHNAMAAHLTRSDCEVLHIHCNGWDS